MLVLLYLYGVRQQFLYVNITDFTIDQGSYLKSAQLLKTSHYTALTDRNRMPLYPFLLSLLYKPGLNEEIFFARAKLFNITLSLFILLVLFRLFRQYLPLATAVILLLIHAFTVYMFKAAYAQAELLFYLLNFLSFLLMCRLLRPRSWQVTWKTAVFTGIILGLAHLTKASILPGLALFVGTAVLRALWGWLGKRPLTRPTRQFWQDLATPALVLFFFLLTIWPYIQNSKTQFGHYFYNVNATFYIWYDHWDDVLTGTRAHGDRIGWPTMPAEEIPSASTYFRSHSIAEISQRLGKGFLITLISMANSYGYLKYVVVIFSLVLGLFLFNPRRAITVLKEYMFVAVFVSSFFSIYLILYAWYTPIANGNRLVLALFSPGMFTFGFIIYQLFEEQLLVKISRNSSKVVHLGNLLHWLLGGILLVDGYIIFTTRIATLYGGF